MTGNPWSNDSVVVRVTRVTEGLSSRAVLWLDCAKLPIRVVQYLGACLSVWSRDLCVVRQYRLVLTAR